MINFKKFKIFTLSLGLLGCTLLLTSENYYLSL
uniref:Lipoprotein n=1 Tax=Aliivibrio wodanis TaxID=80852 RepID=A0A5Q4ZY00_9GAMM|nr:hypothetical protein AW0309160_04229 [Aliivibrio wodanis]